jgi:TPR repeat protein
MTNKYDKASTQQHILATYQLGLLYKSGKGVEPNRNKAIALLQKAAQSQYDTAALQLGIMYKKRNIMMRP